MGKTSLLNCDQRRPLISQSSTIGVDFVMRQYMSKTGRTCRVKLWDTAGQERFKSLVPSYFRDSDGIILAFDLTNKKSFDDLGEWLQQSETHQKRYSGKRAPQILVGIKSDLAEMR